MASNRPIAFFDSGVGLYSILIETKKILPNENFVIFADQHNNPFGEKTKAEVKKFSKSAVRYLIKKHNIKMVVLACNTATVLAIEDLRKNFDIPIVGTVPAIKPAFKISKKNKIAILSSSATAKSVYLSRLVKLYAPGSEVMKLGCRGLENAIDVLDYKKINKLLKIYLSRVKKFGADVVVLGCTHYPLVKKQIKEFLGPKFTVIDSGEAIALRIKNLLKENWQLSEEKTADFYYTTGNKKSFSKISSMLLKYKVEAEKP